MQYSSCMKWRYFDSENVGKLEGSHCVFLVTSAFSGISTLGVRSFGLPCVFMIVIYLSLC